MVQNCQKTLFIVLFIVYNQQKILVDESPQESKICQNNDIENYKQWFFF